MRCRQASFVFLSAVVFGLPVSLSFAHAQPEDQQTLTDNSSLQSLYDAALNSQKAGDFDRAAAQYRQFLAAALDELANANSWAGDQARSFSLFAEALALTPDAPNIELDYAAAALGAGDLKNAESLASAPLGQEGADSGQKAQAHEILGSTLRRMFRDREARKEFEAAVALDPSFANQYDLAAVCLSIDEEKCAVQAFDQIEASTPDTPQLHMTIGLAYGHSDFTGRAVTEFKKVIAEDPSYPEAHYCVAAALLAAGEDEKTLQEAESELKQELTITPNDFLSYAALGKIALGYRSYPEAESDLKRAIALNAKNPDAFLYLGQLDYETNRPKEADPNLRKAIQLTTDVSRNHFQIQKAHFLLGRILMQEHRPTEAHAEMQAAHEMNDKALAEDKNKLSAMLPANGPGAADPNASAALAQASRPQSADPAALKKLKAIEEQLTPPIADSYNNLGALTASQQNYAEALVYFEQARAWQPSLDGLDYNLGRAAFMAADFSAVIPPITRYLRSHPHDAAMRAPLAMSQFMAGNYSACIETLKSAGASVTSMPQMRFIYADSLVKTGQAALGLARLQTLEKENPNDAEVHRAIGEAYELRRDWLNATRELKQAMGLKPDDPETHYGLGKAELETGDTPAAIDDLQAAARLAPSDPRFHRELAVAYDRGFKPAEAEKERQVAEHLKTAQAPDPKTAPARPHRP